MAKIWAITNGFALVITLAINYLSNTGVFNGETMASVSARYSNYFTPAGFTFSIWGLIYLGLICFVVYSLVQVFRKDHVKEVHEIGWWFVLSCIANCLWVLAWLYDFISVSVLIMIFLLFCLTMIIVNTNMERRDDPFIKFICIWWPFAIYSGWISVALIANTAAWLTKMEWDSMMLQPQTWTILMIIIAALLGMLLTWVRNMREFAVTIAWGLFGVAMANKDVSIQVWYAALGSISFILINVFIHAIKYRGQLPWRK